jgi:hypothetical protein
MNVKLREADARAVDLLLDRAVSANGNGGGDGNGAMFATALTTSHAGVSNEQVTAVERILHVLHAMPAAEPAPDLMSRTLDRISTSTASPMRGTTPSLIDLGRPVA